MSDHPVVFAVEAVACIVLPAVLLGTLAYYVADWVIRRNEPAREAAVADEAESWLRAFTKESP